MEADLKEATFPEISAAGQSMGIAVYWPNVHVPDNPADEHLRVSVFPIKPEILKTNGRAQFQWVLQILIYARSGAGEIVSDNYAKELRRLLPYGHELSHDGQYFTVINRGNLLPPVKSGGFFFKPLQFGLRAFN